MARRETVSVLLLSGACNLAAGVLNLGYAALASAEPGSSMPRPAQVGGWVLLSYAFAFTFSIAWGSWALADVDRACADLRAGRAPDPEVLARARRRALGLPVVVVRLSTLLWFLCSLALPLYLRATGLEVDPAGVLQVILVVALVGSVAGVFVFYAEEWYVQRRLVPVLFAEGRLSEAGGPPAPTLRFKILVLVTTTVALPILVLTASAALGGQSTPVMLYLGASFFGVGLLQALAIARSVLEPVEALAGAVARVGEGDLTARAPVYAADVIGRLAETFNSMVEALRRAAFVRETFGRYVSEPVLQEILGGRVELGGEVRTATVLFSDIRGFTALSERLTPAEVVRFLNSYLDAMVGEVVAQGGTVDKFIGDAVMATWGVPVTRPDDALRAVRAAVGMLRRLEAWNAERRATGQPELEIGIGLHTGEVLAGNIGSAQKMEYTVIGDAVNTASRIEGLNKHLGAHLLISEATYQLVQAAVEARRLEPVEVKGKSQKLVVYEVSGLR